jgi:hypothetical protein
MQKERGSGGLPVVWSGAWHDQLLNSQALRHPMQSIWSRRISRALSGVT